MTSTLIPIPNLPDFAATLARIALGALFLVHGIPKIRNPKQTIAFVKGTGFPGGVGGREGQRDLVPRVHDVRMVVHRLREGPDLVDEREGPDEVLELPGAGDRTPDPGPLRALREPGRDLCVRQQLPSRHGPPAQRYPGLKVWRVTINAR